MADCGCECDFEAKNREECRVLGMLLAINAAMFAVELGIGVMAESTGLIADSLDMLADATVYGIALFAVGRSSVAKVHAALFSGGFQIFLAVGVSLDVARRAWFGSEPVSELMMAVGALALAANLVCLSLLAKHRDGEVHMRASWIFSVNDVLANLGVILSGLIVFVIGSRWPDLIIGAVITVLVLRGGIRIVHDARAECLRATEQNTVADSACSPGFVPGARRREDSRPAGCLQASGPYDLSSAHGAHG